MGKWAAGKKYGAYLMVGLKTRGKKEGMAIRCGVGQLGREACAHLMALD